MSDSRIRADRKAKLYKDVCFNNKINKLQSDVHHNRRQRLKNRVNERQNRLFIRQNL